MGWYKELRDKSKYINIDVHVFQMKTVDIESVANRQSRRCYVGIPMDEDRNMNALMVQRCRCRAFDSPGVARNEPTPGERSQGDSTL